MIAPMNAASSTQNHGEATMSRRKSDVGSSGSRVVQNACPSSGWYSSIGQRVCSVAPSSGTKWPFEAGMHSDAPNPG